MVRSTLAPFVVLVVATACTKDAPDSSTPSAAVVTWQDEGVAFDHPRTWQVVPADAVPVGPTGWQGVLVRGESSTATVAWHDEAGPHDTHAEALRTSQVMLESLRKNALAEGADEAVAEDSARISAPAPVEREVGSASWKGSRYVLKMQGAYREKQQTYEVFDVAVGARRLLVTLSYTGLPGDLPNELQALVTSLRTAL